MSPTRRDPLEGVDRLLVDGSNLLAVLAGSADGPPAAVIGRIRAAIPAAVRIDLIFDGPADRSPVGRLATDLTVRYSGRRTADAVLLELAATAAHGGQPPGSNVVLVTDDRALAAQARRHGVRVLGTTWLAGRLERRILAAAAPGNRRAPKAPGGSGGSAGRSASYGSAAATPDEAARDADAAADERRWRPGRGATAKRGPARRPPRATRDREGGPPAEGRGRMRR